MPYRSFGPGMLLASLLAATAGDAAAHSCQDDRLITRLGQIRSGLSSMSGQGEERDTGRAGPSGPRLVQWWPNWGNFWRNF
jgi:hypothetical protein